MDWITSGLAPLYTLGVKLYNYMLGFSLGFGLNTPQGASSTAWAYVSGTLFPFFQAIAATMPSIDALKCIKVTNCYVWFYDDEKECEVKAKKGEGTYFNGNDVEKWEQVKIYGYLIRAIDD